MGQLQKTLKASPLAVISTNKATKTSAITPSNVITTKVLAIICEEVGIKPTELQPENEFADFGLDSLLSLTVTGRIREELGLDLASTVFIDHATVRELRTFIQGNDVPALSSDTSSESDFAIATPEIVSSEDVIDFAGIVRTTIAEETGTDVQEIKPSAMLAELGMDSLLALTIMGRLNEALEIDLPQSLFTENETMIELERALATMIKGTRGLPMSSSENSTIIHTESPPYATSVLLQGNAKTATKKLFLFPDGSGSATSYAQLAPISSEVAVYGLNCPWLKKPQEMTCTLEELTAKYILEIRNRQPTGPYHLGGWSAGGICAYEASQQLALQGETTASLILIDSPNPIGLENPPERMYDFFESLGIFGEGGKAPPPWLRQHFSSFISLLDKYKVSALKPANINTHIIYARDGICKLPTDPRPEMRPDDPREMLWLLNNRTDFSGSGWLQLLGKSNLSISVLDDVNHFTMMDRGPQSKQISSCIKTAIGH